MLTQRGQWEIDGRWWTGSKSRDDARERLEVKASGECGRVRTMWVVGRGKKKAAEKRSEWVGEREPDRVFSDGTLKHVKSPTTTVGLTWCGHGAEQREESGNAYALSWMCKPLLKYPSQCLSSYSIVQPTAVGCALQKVTKRSGGMNTFMYVLSSGILPSAISLLLPRKTFPKEKHINQRDKGAGMYN